jgi:hypothetical protein
MIRRIMTAADSLILSATAELREPKAGEKKRRGLLEELRAMSRAMQEEEGLINHAQAALVLDVSTRRVGELVETGIFRRFEFLGRTYVSVKEVMARREADVKNGRPPRHGLARVKAGVGIAAKYDLPNLAMETILPEVGEKREKQNRKK